MRTLGDTYPLRASNKRYVRAPTPPPLSFQLYETKNVRPQKSQNKPFGTLKQRTYLLPVFASFQKQSTYSE